MSSSALADLHKRRTKRMATSKDGTEQQSESSEEEEKKENFETKEEQKKDNSDENNEKEILEKNKSNSDDDDDGVVNGDAADDGQMDFSVLHPLEHEWTFWFDKRSIPASGGRRKGEMHNYETNLREIGTFGSVEDFWRYYHHIVKPSEMELNSNCHMFVKGVKPMWEDVNNAKGGKWVIVITKQDRDKLNALWEAVVLSLVGETIGDSSELCGAVCSIRKKADKIAVWTRNRTNDAAIQTVGDNFKQLCQLVKITNMKLTYHFHEDALRTTTSYSNPARKKL